MAVFRFGGFLGEFPKLHPRLVPEGGAQISENAIIERGALEAIKAPGNTNIDASESLGLPYIPLVGSLFKLSDDWYLAEQRGASFAWYSSSDDQYGRVIFTNIAPGVPPAVTSTTILQFSGVQPPVTIAADYIELGVDPPASTPSVAVTGVADNASDVPETRYYVTTFVNLWGAESAPSPATQQVEWRPGQVVEITGLPTPPIDAHKKINRVRLYRVNTSQAGVTNYQFVAQFSTGESTSAIVSGVTQESPYGLITTATPHGYSANDEVAFSNFGPLASGGISVTYNTGAVTSETNNGLISIANAPVSFEDGQRVYFENFNAGSTAEIAIGDSEYIIYKRLDTESIVLGQTPAFPSFPAGVSFYAIENKNGNVFVPPTRFEIRMGVVGTPNPSHSIVVGDLIRLPPASELPAAYASIADQLVTVTFVNGIYVQFTCYTATTAAIGYVGTISAVARTLLAIPGTSNDGFTGEMYRCISSISRSPTSFMTYIGHGWTAADNGTAIKFDLRGEPGMASLDGATKYIEYIDEDRVGLYDDAGLTTNTDTSAEAAFVGGYGARLVAGVGMDELNNTTHTIVSVVDEYSFYISQDTSAYTALTDTTLGLVQDLVGPDYDDVKATEDLGEVLATVTYDPPPDNMKGVTSHPAGFKIGFYDNVLVFSEPGFPHAWPFEYRLSTNYPIVGLAVFANNIFVATEGYPYLISGNTPATLVMSELEVEQACVSARGIVDMGSVVCYPSHDGLIMVGPGIFPRNVTEELFTRDQWQALYPSTFLGFNWEGKYCAFYESDNATGGFEQDRAIIIDPFNPNDGVRYVDQGGCAVYKSLEEDTIYFLDPVEDNLYTWADGATKATYTWRSGQFFTPKAVNMSVGKVYADSYADLTFRLYADEDGDGTFSLVTTVVVTSEAAFRLPGGYRAEKWYIELEGTDTVSEVIVATTMAEMAQVV